MSVLLKIKGRVYRRDYKPKFCEICGQRLQFKMSAKGVPESSAKYNKRVGCNPSHSRKIQALRKSRGKHTVNSVVDAWLSRRLIS